MNEFRVLPDLTAEEYEALKGSIEQHGVLTEIICDEEGNLLDGFAKKGICEALGIENIPTKIVTGMSEDEKLEFTLQTNLKRRHVTVEQRQDLVVMLRGRGWSQERIARCLGIEHRVQSTRGDYANA